MYVFLGSGFLRFQVISLFCSDVGGGVLSQQNSKVGKAYPKS